MAARLVIDAWSGAFAAQRSLMEAAVAQLSDEQLHEPVAPGANPVAVILVHIAGSMRSRFTDWLTSDGEKPWRNRESEFDPGAARALSREEIMEQWSAAWDVLRGALEALTPADFDRIVMIRGEAHSVPQAIERQVSHYGYHAGQIVLISRSIVERSGGAWRHLSIPPGQSDRFNAEMRARHGAF